MLPGDDFILLYVAYGLLLLLLLAGYHYGKNKLRWKQNLLFYAVYTGIMIAVFCNPKMFEGGSSLLVLFYGGVFLLLHLAVWLVRTGYLLITEKKKRG